MLSVPPPPSTKTILQHSSQSLITSHYFIKLFTRNKVIQGNNTEDSKSMGGQVFWRRCGLDLPAKHFSFSSSEVSQLTFCSTLFYFRSVLLAQHQLHPHQPSTLHSHPFIPLPFSIRSHLQSIRCSGMRIPCWLSPCAKTPLLIFCCCSLARWLAWQRHRASKKKKCLEKSKQQHKISPLTFTDPTALTHTNSYAANLNTIALNKTLSHSYPSDLYAMQREVIFYSLWDI